MVAEGQRSGFGARLASGGVGVAAGVGVTAAAVGGTASTMAGAAAAASAAVVMLPVVGVAAAWGVAKARKAKKEREVKDATALCLSEAGYVVRDWTVAKRKRPAGTASAGGRRDPLGQPKLSVAQGEVAPLPSLPHLRKPFESTWKRRPW